MELLKEWQPELPLVEEQQQEVAQLVQKELVWALVQLRGVAVGVVVVVVVVVGQLWASSPSVAAAGHSFGCWRSPPP